MAGERKPMSIDEIEAAALKLPVDKIDELMDRLSVHRGMDPEDFAEARRTIDEMKSGRMKGIPMEQLLDELDRMAEAG